MRGPVTKPALRGFSLVELIITMVVLGIIAVTAGAMLMPMFRSHQDVERRAALVEAAEGAIRRMSRDIRISVPNRVRVTNTLLVGTGFAIELIPTADGARYCTTNAGDCSDLTLLSETLSVTTPDSVFDVLGCFRNTAFVPAVLPGATTAYRLAVGNADSGIYIALGASAVITPAGNTITLSRFPNTGTLSCGAASATANSFNRHRVTLSTAAHTFPVASPRHRVFVIEDAAAPVTYICNATAGTLTRYAGYKMASGAYSIAAPNQPTDPLATPLTGATGRLVADNVSACSALVVEATVQTSSIVSLSLTLANSGETVTLVSQVQLDNSQ